MNIIPIENFVGAPRGFGGSLPRSKKIADMFTYLQENYDFKNILEFGFCFGHSSTWFLYAFPNAKVVSYDPQQISSDGDRLWRLQKAKFKNRFNFYSAFSDHARYTENVAHYDIVFVDAGHTYGAVYDDIETALRLKIPLILIDNMELEPQQKAVEHWKDNLQFTKQFKYYTINRDSLKHERHVNLYNVLSYDLQKSV
tara:strand:+ start:3173 stop:3766 length:594 start_codon:yes stop_codon:yes gene_type:complete